jgi:hypothetical protein
MIYYQQVGIIAPIGKSTVAVPLSEITINSTDSRVLLFLRIYFCRELCLSAGMDCVAVLYRIIRPNQVIPTFKRQNTKY